MATVLVLLERRAGDLKRASLQAVSAARQLAGPSGRVDALALGTGAETCAAAVGPAGADRLLVAADAAFDRYAPETYSAHSLRAGFVTYAHTRGATDHAIAHQTRHRSLASVGTYIRTDTAWDDNAATQLGL